jgi:hypothetical protein
MTGLQLTSLGMVTNVGHDVVTACASQRAGLVRNAPLDDVWAYDPSMLEVRVTGAPIKGLADGFVQTDRHRDPSIRSTPPPPGSGWRPTWRAISDSGETGAVLVGRAASMTTRRASS